MFYIFFFKQKTAYEIGQEDHRPLEHRNEQRALLPQPVQVRSYGLSEIGDARPDLLGGVEDFCQGHSRYRWRCSRRLARSRSCLSRLDILARSLSDWTARRLESFEAPRWGTTACWKRPASRSAKWRYIRMCRGSIPYLPKSRAILAITRSSSS